MEFNRFSQRLTVIVTIVLGLISAVVLGKLAGQERLGPILMVVLGGAALTTLLVLKERVWIVLLFAWPMTGQIRALNIPFSVRDLAVMYVFVGYLALIAFKIIRTRNRMTLIDLFMMSVLLMLAIAFIRNPVGVEALGSERVGGRPYFNISIAVLAWWVLSRSDLTTVSPKWIFIAVLLGKTMDGLLATMLHYLPGIEGFFAEFYSCPIMTSGQQDDSAASVLSESTERLSFLGFLVLPFLTALFAWDRPLAWVNIFKPWKPLILAIAVAGLLKSGFRSALMIIVGIAMISGFLRAGRSEVLKMIGIALLALLFTVTFNNVLFDLPKNIQRTLSFLPGNWDAVAVAEGKESTDWRLYMWKQALLTDRYIENKLLGDGFGIKKTDYAIMSYYAQHGTMEDARENLMIVGNFHSGPVTSIRYVGFIGLVLYLAMISLLSREGWKLCRMFKGSAYESLCYLICLPLIIEPFTYVFIFGSFDSAMPEAVFGIGALKLLGTAIRERIGKEERAPIKQSFDERNPRRSEARTRLALQ